MTEVYALDLDEELIAHLAIPESIQIIWDEHFDEDLIVDEEVRDIFRWQMIHLRNENKPATASVLAEEFDLDFEEPLVAIHDLIDRLRERWIRNNAREKMEEISDAYKDDPAKVIQVLPRISREIQDVVGSRGEAYGTGDYGRSINVYHDNVKAGPGPSLGFDMVDRHFHGLRGLTFGIAAPKTYKSWLFGANVIVENTFKGRHGWIYSLELPAVETDMRIRCLAAQVPFWKYLRGALSQQDIAALAEASEVLDATGVYRSVKPAPGHRTIEEMVERAGDAGADFIVIDQLQYVEARNGTQLGAAKPQEFWQPLNAARDLSDQIPIMVVHQFNRSVMNAESMPEMQQAKGAAAIEEIATLALGLWSNKPMRRSNIVEMGTLASRHYQYESWEIGVELSHSCGFVMNGRVEHDDD